MQKYISRGSKTYEDGDWVEWYMYHRLASDTEAREYVDWLGLGSYHGGPGQPFAYAPEIRHTDKYTFILQRGGWDI